MSVDGDLQGKGTDVPRSIGRSLLIVRPLRAGSSSKIHRPVETPVQACPQVLHRPAWSARVKCGNAGPAELALLLVVRAGVDCTVEVIVSQLGLDVGARGLQFAARGQLRLLGERRCVELVEVELVLL